MATTGKPRRKWFSASERLAYHTKRANNPKLSENQKTQSKFWLKGYDDKGDYRGTFRGNKGEQRNCKIMIAPFVHGLKARFYSESKRKG